MGDKKVTILPIDMRSDSAKKEVKTKAKNRPKNLEVIHGEPIQTKKGLTSGMYVGKIASSLFRAGCSLAA